MKTSRRRAAQAAPTKRLKKVIAELEAALRELGIATKPGPPASEAKISAYEARLKRPLPPSYRAFLLLHDGYRGLAYPGDMIAIADAMPGGAWFDRIRQWKKLSARNGAEEVVAGIPIANLGQPNNWAYLDPTKVNARTKEMTVTDWQPDDSDDYRDVVAFLEECLETAREGIDEDE